LYFIAANLEERGFALFLFAGKAGCGGSAIGLQPRFRLPEFLFRIVKREFCFLSFDEREDCMFLCFPVCGLHVKPAPS
jgi:hypothetical protein